MNYLLIKINYYFFYNLKILFLINLIIFIILIFFFYNLMSLLRLISTPVKLNVFSKVNLDLNFNYLIN